MLGLGEFASHANVFMLSISPYINASIFLAAYGEISPVGSGRVEAHTGVGSKGAQPLFRVGRHATRSTLLPSQCLRR